LVTTEAVCWEWMNAMSGAATRLVAAHGYQRIRLDPRIELVPCKEKMNAGALSLFTDHSDKDWNLTDCLSFVVMGRRNVEEALTADHHFEQAGFRPRSLKHSSSSLRRGG
jgi:predicted nucleic acid-binding protein